MLKMKEIKEVVTERVSLNGGPFHGRMLWVRPEEETVRLVILEKPFNMDGYPGEEAVYRRLDATLFVYQGNEPAEPV